MPSIHLGLNGYPVVTDRQTDGQNYEFTIANTRMSRVKTTYMPAAACLPSSSCHRAIVIM